MIPFTGDRFGVGICEALLVEYFFSIFLKRKMKIVWKKTDSGHWNGNPKKKKKRVDPLKRLEDFFFDFRFLFLKKMKFFFNILSKKNGGPFLGTAGFFLFFSKKIKHGRK